MMNKKQKLQLRFNVGTSYLGFLFQTFFKRPMGYIISLVYMLFLAVILIIVPKITRSGPLSIWNIGGFNMPIFNLFFIAAMSASIAVVLFKIGVEDGTELTLSAKPITKNQRVAIKTITYLLIMLLISVVILGMVALVKPIFGEYDLFENIRGITNQEYKSLLLSIFIGNVVNILFFGGLAVLISLIGSQVVTMIGTVGIAFVLCLLNVIYPLAVGTPITVLVDKYGTSINSIACNTLSQIEGDEENPFYRPFATIQCLTQEDGTETQHFDTYEYWTRAQKEAGTVITNYFDFAKQLSALFSGFGLDERRLEEASKVAIGTNPSFKYSVDKNTGLNIETNIIDKKYPVAIYSLYSKQGVSYPVVHLSGGNTGLSVDNWYAFSKLNKADFNSLTCVSLSNRAIISGLYFRDYVKTSYYTLVQLNLGLDKPDIANKQEAANNLFKEYLLAMPNDKDFIASSYSLPDDSWAPDQGKLPAIHIISNDKSGQFFTGNWEDLSIEDKTYAISQVLIHWMVRAQQWQCTQIEKYRAAHTPNEPKFPFSSKTVKNWYIDEVDPITAKTPDIRLHNQQKLIERMFSYGVYVDMYQESKVIDPAPFYVYPVNSELEFCETYKNMYQYRVSSYFNVYVLTGIWTSISIALFAASVIVYKRTDFK